MVCSIIMAFASTAVFAQSASIKVLKNIRLVITALTELFIKKDITALDRYWSDDYIQHNHMIGNGREALMNLFAPMLSNLNYVIGLITGNDDYVMVHGRLMGFGPKPMVVVDIFRIKGGKLAEHWDVMQEEVLAEKKPQARIQCSP